MGVQADHVQRSSDGYEKPAEYPLGISHACVVVQVCGCLRRHGQLARRTAARSRQHTSFWFCMLANYQHTIGNPSETVPRWLADSQGGGGHGQDSDEGAGSVAGLSDPQAHVVHTPSDQQTLDRRDRAHVFDLIEKQVGFADLDSIGVYDTMQSDFHGDATSQVVSLVVLLGQRKDHARIVESSQSAAGQSSRHLPPTLSEGHGHLDQVRTLKRLPHETNMEASV
ncbi:hypothetical protein H257_12824 [Aphanomyces astaci]|uniref:Uncharacterized protein n=1 Tax=Aphanomyces astaci TaxID=112090 RepID=W4FWX0_APHAT|nr:hypothetical protein H257_12824 [Aphanomyces astaci]ETV72020.1 hypothetical protein H257_12824 [Aphanomyces astaci]|eukprot:XP_009838463.1 hypothetical protein H257_12824 [Aphanomyces astaci]